MSENVNPSTANAATSYPKQADGMAATWYKQYISAENMDNIYVDYFAKIIGLLNYRQSGLVGASKFLGFADNGISVKLHYEKKKSDALDRFAKIVKYFPHEKMLEFFNQFADEYFKNVKAVVDISWNRRRRK